MADAPDDRDIADYRTRLQLEKKIIEGRLPSTMQLAAGYPYFKDSEDDDIAAFAREILISKNLTDDQRVLLEVLRDGCTVHGLMAAKAQFENKADTYFRLTFYLARKGNKPAIAEWALLAFTRFQRLSGDILFRVHVRAIAIGMLSAIDGSVEDLLDEGFTSVYSDWHQLETLKAIKAAIEAADDDDGTETLTRSEGLMAELRRMAADAKLRDESDDGIPEFPLTPIGHQVTPPLDPLKVSGFKREIYKTWAGIAGVPLPIVQRGNVGQHAAALVARWPYAQDVIYQLLGDLAVDDDVKFRPTVLVGPPGCGKSALARAIADQIGLPVEMYSLSGQMDSSLMGTSAQWNSARECVPLQLIKRSKTANPLMIWDEIEKAGSGGSNGNALDALLPLLEPSQARAYRDLALEVEVDLSFVSHIATANTLTGVPGPVLDRLRVIHMPPATWQHIGTLAQGIVADIAKARGFDPRWIAPIAPDELDVVKKSWKGGSLRRLRRAIETLVDGRDAIMPRA